MRPIMCVLPEVSAPDRKVRKKTTSGLNYSFPAPPGGVSCLYIFAAPPSRLSRMIRYATGAPPVPLGALSRSRSASPVDDHLLIMMCAQVDFKTRIGWTIGMVVVFMWASNIPLYGIPSGLTTSMPSDIMRIVLASGHGTIMDLGEFS
ncbi:unnamed protein product [Hapterophycus canaliculatus]